MSSNPTDNNNNNNSNNDNNNDNVFTTELGHITIEPDDGESYSGKVPTHRQRAIQTILQNTPHEPEQIDALAAEYGWFRGDPAGATYATVQAYNERFS